MSPYNTILYSIVFCLLSGVGALCVYKGLTIKSNKHLFLFIITNILFIISMYAGYEFFIPEYPQLTTFFFRCTFVFALFMSFFICTFAYYYPRKTRNISKWKQDIFLLLTIVMAILSLFTDWFYKSVVVENNLIVGDVHGTFHDIYIFHYLLNSTIAIYLSFQKNFQLKGIERLKNILSFLGIFIVLMGTIIFYTILPKFNIYLLQEEGGLFSIFFLIFVAYSMFKYRFLGVRFIITRFIRNIAEICLTLFLLYGMIFLFMNSLFSVYFLYIVPLFFLLSFYFHVYIAHRFVSYIFHRFLGLVSIEFFEESMRSFCTHSYVYASVDEFKEDIYKFLKSQRIECKTLFLFPKSVQKQYPAIKEYFCRYPKVLFREEHSFLETNQCLFLEERPKELQTFGEICFPLFRAPGELMGFLVLGKKVFKDRYTKEEVHMLDRLKGFIELRLTGILYRDYLHREITKKTEILLLRNKEIEQSYGQLKTLDEAKDTFLSIASHELRTPMTVIKGFIDLLLSDESSKNFSFQQKEFLNIISKNTEDLTILVNKMLDISSLEAGKMEFLVEDILLADFLEKIVKEFEPMCSEKNIHVEFQNKENLFIHLRTDPLKLKQIMGNLLGNALKFSEKKGKITVLLEKGNSGTSLVNISVIDIGIGIPKAEQSLIFEKFYRTKHSSQKTCSGTGLGLNIVQLLVQKMGGDISVKSKKNGGTQFTFSLSHIKE